MENNSDSPRVQFNFRETLVLELVRARVSPATLKEQLLLVENTLKTIEQTEIVDQHLAEKNAELSTIILKLKKAEEALYYVQNLLHCKFEGWGRQDSVGWEAISKELTEAIVHAHPHLDSYKTKDALDSYFRRRRADYEKGVKKLAELTEKPGGVKNAETDL